MAKSIEQPVAIERTDARPITPMFWAGGPFDSMLKWEEEVDRILDDLGWGGHVFRPVRTTRLEETSWLPAVEVFEKGGEFVVRAELPGLNKENISVDVDGEMLILRGERKHEKEETKEHFYRSERSYGNFYRAIALPEGVKTENVKAVFKDGVLEITIPAPPAIQKRVRHVEVGEASVKQAGKAAA